MHMMNFLMLQFYVHLLLEQMLPEVVGLEGKTLMDFLRKNHIDYVTPLEYYLAHPSEADPKWPDRERNLFLAVYVRKKFKAMFTAYMWKLEGGRAEFSAHEDWLYIKREERKPIFLTPENDLKMDQRWNELKEEHRDNNADWWKAGETPPDWEE